MKSDKGNKNRVEVSKLYTEDEFKILVSILPKSLLVEPIKRNSKKFRNETRGFRLDNLPEGKITNIYLNHVYRNFDYHLTQRFELLLEAYEQSIEEKITNEIEPAPEVFAKIESNDMKCFRELCMLLLETRFEKRVDLYFKVIGYSLTKEQIAFCQNELVKIMNRRKLEKEIKKKLSSELKQEKTELEKQFTEEVANKKQQISLLEQQLNEMTKEHDNELLHKDKVISDLKGKLAKAKQELNKEKGAHKEMHAQMDARINKLKAELAQQNEQMNKLRDKLNMKDEQFTIVAQKKWEETNRHLVQERKNVQASIKALTETKAKMENEVDRLRKEKNDLENKLAAVKNDSKRYLTDLRKILQAVGHQPGTAKDGTDLLWIKSVKTNQSVERISDYSDFIDDLSDNLRLCGIDSNRVYNVACYLYAAFANNLCPLFVGYNAREVADAISYVMCGSSADIIGLPLGFNDSNQLITVSNSATSKVIVLENVVDAISESVYLPLVKQNSDKLFVFSTESTENLHLTASSLLHYMAILDLDSVISDEDHSDDYVFAVTDEEVFNIAVERADREQNRRRVNHFDDVVRLSNAAKLKLAEVVSVMDRIGSSNAIYDVLNFSIKLLCAREDKLDEFRNFAKKYEHHAVT